MFDGGSAGDNFLVGADSLVSAARDVGITAQMVRDGLVEGLDEGVDVGHEELRGALEEFTSRWQAGADALINHQHDIAGRLTDCARAYVEQDAASEARYLAQLSGR